jgi:hypothetical protein
MYIYIYIYIYIVKLQNKLYIIKFEKTKNLIFNSHNTLLYTVILSYVVFNI